MSPASPSPEALRVQPPAPAAKAGRMRLAFAIIVSAMLAVMLCWIAAPALLGMIMGAVDPTQKSGVRPLFLLCDMLLSMACVYGSAWLAIVLAKSRPYIAALGVSALASLVYFREVGGIGGMLDSQYPYWYEFFPSNWVAGALAAFLTVRWTKRKR